MRASSLGRNMFCSEGIFGVVLFPASEISLLKRASSWGWDRRLTLLIGPCSQYRGFYTSKIFVTCGQLRNQGAARPTGVDIDTAEVSSEVGIFSGQESAYNRKQVFLPVHPPPSFLYCMNPAAWQQVDVGRRCPKGQKISPCHVPVLATCAHDLMLQTPQLGSSGWRLRFLLQQVCVLGSGLSTENKGLFTSKLLPPGWVAMKVSGRFAWVCNEPGLASEVLRLDSLNPVQAGLPPTLWLMCGRGPVLVQGLGFWLVGQVLPQLYDYPWALGTWLLDLTGSSDDACHAPCCPVSE